MGPCLDCGNIAWLCVLRAEHQGVHYASVEVAFGRPY